MTTTKWSEVKRRKGADIDRPDVRLNTAQIERLAEAIRATDHRNWSALDLAWALGQTVHEIFAGPDDALDVPLHLAWKRAESALAARASLYELRVGRWSEAKDYWAEGWYLGISTDSPTHGLSERGPTPAAALHALAETIELQPR